MKKTFKVLVAYDGSKAADAALADLRLAGLPAICEARVLTVADLWLPPADMTTGMVEGWYAQAYASAQLQAKASQKQAKTLAQRAESFLKAEFPTWKVNHEAMVEHPAQGILNAAEKFQPDLIVMGSHGHSALGRIFLGSVSLKVLNHAHGSVRITRSKGRLPTAPRLLVGIDGSRDATAAIAAIAARPWPKGTQVHIVTVVDERLRLTGAKWTKQPKPGKGLKPEGWLQLLVETAEKTLATHGLKVTASVLEGDAREVLLKEAKRLKPHCIFLGSRGLNAVQRFFLGSVSTDLVVHAPCTVEIVRP